MTLSHIWTMWPYKTTGVDKTSDTQNLLRNIAAWSACPPWWVWPTNDFLPPWPSCEADIPPRSPACLPASVVLRPVSRSSSTSPPVAILSRAPAQSLTLANSVVTYIQYEYYFGTQHDT